MKPSIGRIVHYRIRPDGYVYPAVVCDVYPKEGKDFVDLSVFTSDVDEPLKLYTRVQPDTGDGGWSWPEKI